MIHEIISLSRSVRSFDESNPVSRETLEKLIDSARLSPSAMNAQPLKYILITEREECEKVVSMTKYASALPGIKLPPDKKHPTAFIIVCADTEISSADGRFVMFDAGLACQSITLRAHEEGIGGVILASFSPERLSDALSIPERFVPLVAVALGKPDEKVVLCEVENGSTKYFRDENNTHYVPKRSLDEVIIR